jgi:beta-lactamase regulating signal transducer with metallopeptidase domain
MTIPMDLVLALERLDAGAWLAALELKVSVVLACAGLASVVLSRASARLRHALWSAALAGALALPALPLVLPALPLALLPAKEPASEARPAFEPGPALATEPLQAGAPLARTAGAPPVQEPAGPEPPSLADLPPGALLFGVWLLGVLALLGSLAGSLVSVRRLEREARDLTDESWAAPLRQARQLLGIARPVRLVESSRVAVPMTAGALRPVIFLPAEAEAWSEERRRLVLLHELTHVRRVDWPLQVLGLAARALHWCNPLAWIALRCSGTAREHSCDEGVLALGAKPSVYAKHLLEIAVSISERTSAPVSALAMARRSQLEGRFMSILTSRSPRRPGPATLFGTVLGMGAIVLSVGAAEPYDQTSAPVPPVEEPAPAAKDRGTFRGETRTEAGPEGDVVVSHIGQWDGNLVVEKRFDGGLRVSFTAVGARLAAPPVSLDGLRPGVSIHLATWLRGSTRSLTATSVEAGHLVYHWQVDGRKQAFDEAAQSWMHATLAVVSDVWEASSLRGQESSLRGEISSVRGEESSLRGEISSVRGEESSLRGEISSVRGEESSLRGEISSVRGEESSLRGEISSIRGEESSLRGEISSLRAAEGDHEEEIRRVRRQIEALDVEGKVREVQRRIEALDVEGKVREVQRQIEALDVEGKVRAIERKIEALDVEGKVGAIQRKIEALDVEGKVRAIELQIKALDAERRVKAIEERLKSRVQELRRLLESS